MCLKLGVVSILCKWIDKTENIMRVSYDYLIQFKQQRFLFDKLIILCQIFLFFLLYLSVFRQVKNKHCDMQRYITSKVHE